MALFSGIRQEWWEIRAYLNSSKVNDLSRQIWQRKAKAWKEINLTIVSPSRWLADCARSSAIFRELRIEVIPCGLDTKIYKPLDQYVAREVFNLPHDKNLILFGALIAVLTRIRDRSITQAY